LGGRLHGYSAARGLVEALDRPIVRGRAAVGRMIVYSLLSATGDTTAREVSMARQFLKHLIAAAVLIALAGAAPAGAADELFTRSKAGSFDDVKFDLTNAIIDHGLVVDHTGNIAGKLERTGADVGSTKQLYRHAEYFVFCSAKLSRAMMEADPANVGICPFVVFAYERADKPGEIVVGFRNPPARGGDASQKSLQAVAALLKDIVTEAVK
jgi:hypothetical protein